MANTKQQKKRILTNEKRRLRNVSFESSLKTARKRVEAAVASGDKEAAALALKNFNSKLDKAVNKGIIHKNNCANHKANLAKLVNSME